MAEVGRRMGFGAAFAFRHASEIFAEHAALSGFENLGSRDFDISGVDPKVYDGMAPFQWPRPQAGDAGTTRFFADGRFYHADGKARFIVTALPEVDRTSADYPLTLNTGRIRDQWHTMTRTGKSARLTAHIAEPFAELHPRDAQALGIESADLVELESPHGKVLLRALISERQARGSVFAPMHWNDQFASRARIDMVVAPVTDPYSGQPASKNTGVRARRFEAKAYGFAISRTRPDAPDCAYWAIAKRMAAIAWSLPLRKSRRTGRSGRDRSSASTPGSSRWVTATGKPAICALPFRWRYTAGGAVHRMAAGGCCPQLGDLATDRAP